LLSKVKTTIFLKASPVKRVCPWVRSLWKRLIAVGAVKRSSKRASWLAVAAGGATEVALAAGTDW